jgi:hypothetical protein
VRNGTGNEFIFWINCTKLSLKERVIGVGTMRNKIVIGFVYMDMGNVRAKQVAIIELALF